MTASESDEKARWIAAPVSELAPEAHRILLRSHACEDAGPQREVDLLVVAPEVSRRQADSAGSRRELRHDVTADSSLVSEGYAQQWADLERGLANIALGEGRENVPA